jgi:pilus assembly protein CpaF
LADGSRLHAVIPPVAVDGPVVAVRRFTEAMPDLAALVAAGGVTEEGAGLLRAAVAERRNLLVTGGTGAGKTTLLNVLSKEIDPADRTVTVEDAAELKLSGHVVRLEARPPNAEGAGEVTLRTLLRHALRLRPDRIIIGEVRGPEALDMIQAMIVLGPSPSRSALLMNPACLTASRPRWVVERPHAEVPQSRTGWVFWALLVQNVQSVRLPAVGASVRFGR